MTGAPVLFHARGRMTPDECAFHARLERALRERGSGLALVTHHPPSVPLACHHAVVPNGLEALGRWRAFDGSRDLAGLDARPYLAREVLWRGVPNSETAASLRERGVRVGMKFSERVLDELRPRSCIIWNGQHPQEMILTDLCERRSVPVVHLERGPFPGTLHPDHAGILGGSEIAAMDAWPEPSDQARRVFGSVTARLNAGSATWWDQPDPLGPEGVRRALGIPPTERVALFFGQVDADAQNILYAPAYATNLDAFRAWVRTVPNRGWFVLGKHHPKSATPPKAYRAVLREAGIAGAWADDVSMIDVLCLANRATAVNSGALYESLLVGLPVQTLGRGLLSGKGIAFEADDDFFGMSVDEHARRAKRWRSFGAWLLSGRLCAMDPALEELGVPGPGLLADTALTPAGGLRCSA